MEFLEALAQATALWGKIIAGSFKKKGGSTRIYNLGDYASVDQLNKMTDLDRSGVSTAFALWGLSHRRLREYGFTFEEIIERAHESSKEFELSLELYRMMRHPAIESVLTDSATEVRKALVYYKADKKTIAVANDFEELADCREAAVRASNDLQVYQFAWGAATGDAGKLNPSIYRFLDVNGAVNAIQLCGQLGITLAIVSDNEAEKQEDKNSFFAIFVYDGGTLTMLTDKTEWAHPKQAGMHRNDRHVQRKHEKSFFPYDLLDIVFDETGKFATVKERTGLINFDFKMSRVKDIREVAPKSVIFLAMLMELVKRRFVDQKERTKALAYTVAAVHPIAIEANGGKPTSLINVSGRVKLPTLKMEDVSHETVEWDQEGNHGFFKWAEDRYLPKMPEAWLNTYAGDPARLIGERAKSSEYLSLATTKPDTFGTLKELGNYQRWTARYNQATFVQDAIQKDIKASAKEIKQWLQKATRRNMNAIEKAVAYMSMPVVRRYQGFARPTEDREINLCDVTYKDFSPGGWIDNFIKFGSRNICHYNAAKASVYAVFDPASGEEFAKLFGVEVAELPFLLQHYAESEPYTGNSILSNIDPMDWVPDIRLFRPLKTRVFFGMSKTGFNQLRAKFGLPKFTDWKSIEKEKVSW